MRTRASLKMASGRAVQRQELDHVAHVAALVGASVQLTVAVRAGAPFTETVVAVAVDLAARIQRLEVVTTRLNRLTPVQHVRENAVARQLIRAKQTRRAITDDQDARPLSHFAQRIAAQGRARLGVGQRNLQVETHPAAARVERALFNGQALEFAPPRRPVWLRPSGASFASSWPSSKPSSERNFFR